MKHIPNDFSSRHCPNDSLNKTGEKFFQIWSHKAANISNDLIEYTIRRMQNDRLQFLFQTRNEFTHQENVLPICQMSVHTEDDLQRIKEHIRCFCLSTRNVYRHLRSDSRLYPKMSIDLDQRIMMKICRFIFKTKVLIQIFSKEQHLSDHKYQNEIHDLYRNIVKAFIVLQSNFEILFGDILERDFLQNVKTAVQTLPIILDTSKTIRLIFCALYKLSEPLRQAEAKAIRQRRLTFCESRKQELIITNNSNKKQEKNKFKIINEIQRINQSQIIHTSATTPVRTGSTPMKTFSDSKAINQMKTKTKESSTKIQPSKSKTLTPHLTVSKTNKNLLSPSIQKKADHSSKKSSTSVQKKNKQGKSSSSKKEKQKKAKNKNASTTDSVLSYKYIKNNNCYPTEVPNEEKIGWTTWLHNATLSLATILPSNQTNLHANSSKPLLTTWASLDRISKL